MIELARQGRRAADSKAVDEYRTSPANRAPPSGARKIAPTPPAAPASIKIRRSLTGSRSTRARYDPNPDPICAIGPS